MVATTSQKVAAGGAGAILVCLTFTPIWEGIWLTARKDMVGTGHPVTYCYGQTDEFGAVKPGQKFTVQECKQKLAESLPAYWNKIAPCIKVDLADKTKAALLDAAYNAGPAAVCKSPMLKKMNAGDIAGGCNAFDGWYVRGDGHVLQGLINRRSGDKTRKGEKQLCLEGLTEVKTPATPPPVIKPISKPAPSFWARLKAFLHI